MRILTALITFNRLNLLKRCLDAIEKQSYKNYDILVINNSSTDGSENYLKNKKIKFITQPNFGSATGWHSCIKYAFKKNYDYIWLMDDDGYPDSLALEKLSKQFLIKKNLVCVSSVVLNEKKRNELVFPLPILNKFDQPIIFSRQRKFYFLDDLINKGFSSYPYAQLFNGSLISIENLKIVGNVNKNYFIYGEEVDFFWRMKKIGIVETRLDAYHYHPSVSRRKYSDIKIYYYIKNTIINNYKYLSNIKTRNLMIFIIILFRVYSRNGFIYIISLLFGTKSKFFYKAFFRGFKKKLLIDHES